MGKMNDLWIQRDEWREALTAQLGETLTIIEVDDPFIWRAITADGVFVTKIEDSLYVETCIHAFTEIALDDADAHTQLYAALRVTRERAKSHRHLKHLTK